MAHPYPAHDSRLPYTGKYRYFLTFSTDLRRALFVDDAPVILVRTQILRAAGELRFEIDAYCFMPDHVHLIATGSDEASDAKGFIKLAKQYSGYYFKKEYGVPLWQRYGYERVIREDIELALTVRYILENPSRLDSSNTQRNTRTWDRSVTRSKSCWLSPNTRLFRLKAEATSWDRSSA